MKRIILSFALILFTLPALAVTIGNADIDLGGLTQEQRAQLLIGIERTKEQNDAPSGSAASSEKLRTEVQAWADMGKGVGTMMVSAAKEVGMAAEEFSHTDIGKLTIAIGVIKLMKDEIALLWSSGIGFVFLIISLITWWYAYKRIIIKGKIERVTVTKLDEKGLFGRALFNTDTTYHEQTEEMNWAVVILCICQAVIWGVFFIIIT